MQAQKPFAHVLHVDVIAKLARTAVIDRGRAYADEGRVKAFASKSGQLVGSVQGTSLYYASIWVKGDGLGYTCTCPAGRDGDFCKHCVAVALVWMASQTACG